MARKTTTKSKEANEEEKKITPPETSVENKLVPPQEEKLTPPPDPKLEDKKEKDYLWQYEFHHDTGRPYFQLQNRSDIKYMPPQPGTKSAKMKAHLLGQEKKEYSIPRNPNESKEILQTVNMNGYHLELPKNTYIYLPIQIVEFLKESQMRTENALKGGIEGDTSKENVLL